jgi:CRP/FNR family transcriptional regulator
MHVAANTNLGEKTWHLRRFSVFDHFDRAELESVTRVLRVQQYARREAIFLPSNEPENVYFLLTGRVKITRVDPGTGKELILFIVRPGELFGLLRQDDHAHASTSATALQRALVGYIRRPDFDRLSTRTGFARELSKLVDERLVRVTNRLEELVFRDVPSRLARLLLRLADEFPRRENGRRAIDVRHTQQELADHIAATRETTNIPLNDFKRRGLLDGTRRSLVILDPQGLRKIAK